MRRLVRLRLFSCLLILLTLGFGLSRFGWLRNGRRVLAALILRMVLLAFVGLAGRFVGTRRRRLLIRIG